MLHDYLVNRGVREACDISFVLPLPSPVPPSPETSRALVAAFEERSIKFIPGRRVASVDGAKRVALLDDGAEMAFDLFLGVPKHRVPDVVVDSGMAEDGWIPVNPRTLETRVSRCLRGWRRRQHRHPESRRIRRRRRARRCKRADCQAPEQRQRKEYDGFGTCYIEFGGGRIGKVEVDFFSGPKPTGTYYEPSLALRAEKETFGSSRRARWFCP